MKKIKEIFISQFSKLSCVQKLSVKNNNLQKSLDRVNTRLNNYTTWVPPGHFYSPIPSLEYVKSNEKEIFSFSEKIPAIDLNVNHQLEIFEEFKKAYGNIPFEAEKKDRLLYFYNNPAYSYGDAISLHLMIRKFHPKKIIEIGSGYSSCVMLDTNRIFLNNSAELIFIDPYPELLNLLIKDNDQKVEVIGEDLQKIPINKFAGLDESDILFVDSTHVSKIHSDVNYIIFEVFPKLKSGVVIHLHDVFYPFEYPKDWIYEGRAWNEDYILRAFLQYNDAFEILYWNDYMFKFHKDKIEQEMPLYLKNSGGSIWLRKK